MSSTPKIGLEPLSQTELAVRDPAEDIRGRAVTDVTGEALGFVDDLLIDLDDQKVRFIRIATGGILGLGEDKYLMPVDAIAEIGDRFITVDQTRESVGSSPKYDPALSNDQGYFDRLFNHYGYAPYWSPGYVYPPYPRYPAGGVRRR